MSQKHADLGRIVESIRETLRKSIVTVSAELESVPACAAHARNVAVKIYDSTLVMMQSSAPLEPGALDPEVLLSASLENLTSRIDNVELRKVRALEALSRQLKPARWLLKP